MNSRPMILRLVSGSLTPASAARNCSRASTTVSRTPVAATKSFSTCSGSPDRSSPWSTKTQVSWSPTARCPGAAATAESTPPDSPQITLAPATWARIAATPSATTFPAVQVGARPAPRYRKFSRACWPSGECLTSGCHCRPYRCRSRSSNAATGAPGEWASTWNPAGATGEYGGTTVSVQDPGVLLTGSPTEQSVWMSHGVAVQAAPAGFHVLAHSPGAPVAAFEDRERHLYGLQWHPEVKHSPLGQHALENFLYRGAGLAPTWTAGNVVAEGVAAIRAQVAGARVICGLSGGVDSAVAAALVQRAVGDQLTCVFVDHGLLRSGEPEQVEKDFVAATGVRLTVVDAREQFLAALAGVSEPETKRKIIGREFIRTFEAAAREIVAESGAHGEQVRYLVQGTLYPDVVESGGGEGAANIKSHHNVGGLPDDLQFELVEPLRTLFKDKVRAVG